MSKKKQKNNFLPFLNIYWLNYYGINVFLCVGDGPKNIQDEHNRYWVYELKTKKNYKEKYERLIWDPRVKYFKAQDKTKCVLIDAVERGGNSWSKPPKCVKIDPHSEKMTITIDRNSEVYRKARQINPDKLFFKTEVTIEKYADYENFEKVFYTKFEMNEPKEIKILYYDA